MSLGIAVLKRIEHCYRWSYMSGLPCRNYQLSTKLYAKLTYKGLIYCIALGGGWCVAAAGSWQNSARLFGAKLSFSGWCGLINIHQPTTSKAARQVTITREGGGW